jgi:hypothetical protein
MQMNNILRMLNLANMAMHCETVFHLLTERRYQQPLAFISGDQVTRSFTTTRSFLSIRPSLFTIAELIRAARASRKVQLAAGALVWALDSDVHLPIGLIRDCISFVYE